MFGYLPELRQLWYFCQEVYQLCSAEQVQRLARRRRTLLWKNPSYQEVPELAKARNLLQGEKFDKLMVFLESPVGERVRTNNPVERANRQLRFDEKVRYKFRTERSLNRFLCLGGGELAQQDLSTPPRARNTSKSPETTPEQAQAAGGD
jgi:transposase-like protein